MVRLLRSLASVGDHLQALFPQGTRTVPERTEEMQEEELSPPSSQNRRGELPIEARACQRENWQGD